MAKRSKKYRLKPVLKPRKFWRPDQKLPKKARKLSDGLADFREKSQDLFGPGSQHSEDLRVLQEFWNAIRMIPADVSDDTLLISGRIVNGAQVHYLHWSVGQLRRIMWALHRRGVVSG